MNRSLVAVVVALGVMASASAQNSTRKIRPQPSAQAARAGEAIAWRNNLADALADATQEGKPVFWYVATLPGSPMDRQPVIDRYMLAGPFSWPKTLDLLNQHYVPLRKVPTRKQQEKYGLETFKFIEPGYLVLNAKGKELSRQESLSTFQPAWFLKPLAEQVKAPWDEADSFPGRLPEEVAGEFFRGGDEAALKEKLATLSPGLAVEARFLHAAGLYLSRDEQGAVDRWRALAEDQPNHPLAAKAAMEAEGLGPLVRGFEIYEPLPQAVLEGNARGSTAPRGVYTEAELWELSGKYLIRMQRADGSYRDSQYDFGGSDSLPNVHFAITALVAQALLEATRHSPEDASLAAAFRDARDHVMDLDHVNLDDSDERVWTYLYLIRFLCRWQALEPDAASQIGPLLQQATDLLVAMQNSRGAWFHEYPSGFMTASALVALADAKRSGATIPDEKKCVRTGLALLDSCRTKKGAYSYYIPRRQVRADTREGVGRMPLGATARLLWGADDESDVKEALTASFEHERFLFEVRRYDDHASPFGYGGFFFWFDLQARTEAMLALPEGRPRTGWIERQHRQILDLPEIDGCFVDSHELGRVYGTAMALICLGLLSDSTPQ